ncbi:MAG TPA: CopG family transcriptional regulator [Candidatus Sulfotelmatobacter sp.]
MAGTALVTLRLDPKLKNRQDRLAESTSRSRSFVATEAIREYIELNEWQVQETEKALAEADRGDFATDKEVERVIKKWKRRAR